jgi:hypothetical protein
MLVVDKCQIIFNCYGFVRTHLEALGTTNTTYITGFLCDMSLIFVAATHIDTPAFRTLFTKLNQEFRAGFHTGATSCTFIIIHFGNHSYRIHLDGIKFTGQFAIAKAQTAPRAIGFATVQIVSDKTMFYAIVFVVAGTMLTSSIAAYNSHFRSLSYSCFT